MTAVSLAPGLIEVTMFGGDPHFDLGQRDSEVQSIAATTIIRFSELHQCARVCREDESCAQLITVIWTQLTTYVHYTRTPVLLCLTFRLRLLHVPI